MTMQKKTARLEEQGGQGTAQSIHNTNCNSDEPVSPASAKSVQASRLLIAIECHTKKARALNHHAHYSSLNRFEASRQLYDSTLSSTVSAVANKHGIVFYKHWKAVPSRAGGLTKVRSCALANESKDAALNLLGDWRVTP